MDINEVISKFYIPTVVQVGIDDKFVGTGFFIAPNTVLTCAHVFMSEDTQQAFHSDKYLKKSVVIKWNETILKGKIESLEFSNPIGGTMTNDFALIQMDQVPPHPIAVLEDKNINLRDECYALGFPEGKPQGDSVTLEYEGTTNAALLKFKGGQIQPGFSGSAILNTRTGKVCGMIKRTRDYASPYGGWGIPIASILERNPVLLSLHRNNTVNKGWEYCIGVQSQKSLKVAIISSEYQPHVIGGLGVHVVQLTKALAKEISVELILPEQRTAYQVPPTGVTLNTTCGTPVYNKPCTWLDFARQASYELDRIQPDIIHCHDWCTVLAGIRYRWNYKKPLVFHIHLPNFAPLASSIENLGLICADLVTVNSKAVRQELLNRGLPISRIEIIPNGVDTMQYKLCEDWPAEGPYILFSGRLVKQKGIEFLIRAFYYVKEKYPDICLKIAGDGDYESYLKRLATNLMISEKVQFLGLKSEQELSLLYQKAQIVIIPSIYEPFGMVALEAMACGRPVVASRVGGLKEIIEEGKTGYFAEPENYLDLAQSIMLLLANESHRHQLGQNANEFANNEKYQWSSVAQQYISYYHELTDASLVSKMIETKKKSSEKLKRKIISAVKQMDNRISDDLLNNLFDWM